MRLGGGGRFDPPTPYIVAERVCIRVQVMMLDIWDEGSRCNARRGLGPAGHS